MREHGREQVLEECVVYKQWRLETPHTEVEAAKFGTTFCLMIRFSTALNEL